MAAAGCCRSASASTALLAVAAVASGGRPLSTSKGTGPGATFFDYVFTTIAIAAVAMTLVVISRYVCSVLGPEARRAAMAPPEHVSPRWPSPRPPC